MSRKNLFIIIVLILVITACSPDANETQTADKLVAVKTEAVVDSTTEPTTEAIETKSVEPTAAVIETSEGDPKVDDAVFVDDLGREIVLSETPSAIVSLGPSSLESLFAIGAGSQIVGREEFSTFPVDALEITSVGSLWGELPLDAILALEPDLVIAPEIISVEQVQSLEDIGLTVYYQTNPNNFESLFSKLRTLAIITDHVEEAELLISELGSRVEAIIEKVAEVDQYPTVFYELDATDPENPYTIGDSTFINTIITMAGGMNIGSVVQGAYAQISSKEVLVQNPMIILLADAAYGVSPESVAGRAGWDGITAIQEGNVFPFDPFLVSVPGPRMVDGLETMAALLHPDLFE